MKDVKCDDCAELKNEWCEKKMDSPYPDILRDCQYFHEKKDLVEVVRCKDCKYYRPGFEFNCACHLIRIGVDDYCSCGERRQV